MPRTQPKPCLTQAWLQYQTVLLGWLLSQTQDSLLAEDVLQDVFVKAIRQKDKFCRIDNVKAWLFKVAKNRLVDHYRESAKFISSRDLNRFEQPQTALEPIDALVQCLPRQLERLAKRDRHIIQCCDIVGMSQQDYARQHKLSLPAAKSCLQRARVKLKQQLNCACQIAYDEQQQICCFKPKRP
ncbi:sigma-70 family RNA polymerase sigma factor [Agarivorans sp. QJM3NY_25]|uniref:sigma-70 family RNA polymerase sigma factor n=1 Tax=Agarivorans sp. QJM3NY_25 TaxID=3421430 RepID=UPI003D7E5200